MSSLFKKFSTQMSSSKTPSPPASTTDQKPTTNLSSNPNLESFACLWLDQNVNSTDDNRETQQELRQVINYLRTFDKSDKCEQYIRQITHEKVVLIVSGSLGQQVVPRLHSLPQFSACYVFCGDKQANEQWAKQYSKVTIFTLLKKQSLGSYFRSKVYTLNVLNWSMQLHKIKMLGLKSKRVHPSLSLVITQNHFKLIMLSSCGFNCLLKFFCVCIISLAIEKNSSIFVRTIIKVTNKK